MGSSSSKHKISRALPRENVASGSSVHSNDEKENISDASTSENQERASGAREDDEEKCIDAEFPNDEHEENVTDEIMGNCGVAQTDEMNHVIKSGFLRVKHTKIVTSDKRLLQKMRNSFKRDMAFAFQRTCSQTQIKKSNRGYCIGPRSNFLRMTHNIEEYFKFAKEIANEAGERVKTDFYKNKNILVKENFADLVTETDRAVEDLIFGRIMEKYPTHKCIGEETVSAGGHCELTDVPTWIVDPVDGTTNFVHGVPHTCISIGVTINKQPVLGIVHAPILGETFTAMKGHGAFCNDTKLSVSTINELNRSIVILEGGTSRVPEILDTKIANIKSVIGHCHGIRCYGSAAINMCSLPVGLMRRMLSTEFTCGTSLLRLLLCREAGGVVCDPSGGELDLLNRRVLAACNKTLADQLSAITTNIDIGRTKYEMQKPVVTRL